MLAEKVHHAIGRTVTFEAPSTWSLPKASVDSRLLRFPIRGTKGSFEFRVVSAPGDTPETFLISQADAMRQRVDVPLLDLDVDDREDESGTRKLMVQFDVASYVWRGVLLVGREEWVLGIAIVPRAEAEQHFGRFDGLTRCFAFNAAVTAGE
jgi:hypothetical protein